MRSKSDLAMATLGTLVCIVSLYEMSLISGATEPRSTIMLAFGSLLGLIVGTGTIRNVGLGQMKSDISELKQRVAELEKSLKK